MIKFYQNKHHDNLVECVTPWGNINYSCYHKSYEMGVDSDHWNEVSYDVFRQLSYPETVSVIEFIFRKVNYEAKKILVC
jgi:hypothetical protein